MQLLAFVILVFEREDDQRGRNPQSWSEDKPQHEDEEDGEEGGGGEEEEDDDVGEEGEEEGEEEEEEEEREKLLMAASRTKSNCRLQCPAYHMV